MKERIAIFALALLSLVFYAGIAYSCGAPDPKLVKTPITSLSQCIVRDHKIYSEGEFIERTVTLEKGKVYRVSATGCEYTKTVEISLSRGSKVIASDSGKPANFCFIAPESGAYTLKVKMKALYSGYGNGRIYYCLYDSYECD